MNDEAPSIRFRVFAFIGLFVLVAAIWGASDLLRYLMYGDKPSPSELMWLIGAYTVVWFAADFQDQFKRNRKRLDDMESRLAALERRDSN